MKFEQKVMAASKVKERKLLHPSSVAMVKPDTGVDIKKKSAYYVIRDCATLANEYIPHKCYGSLDDPMLTLNGLFDQGDIVDFVSRSHKSQATRQLLWIIFSDIHKLESENWTPPVVVAPAQVLEIDADADGDEIYGDYGYYSDEDEEPADTEIVADIPPPVDLGDSEDVINKLMHVFGVIS
jgi:hypothetical protein